MTTTNDTRSKILTMPLNQRALDALCEIRDRRKVSPAGAESINRIHAAATLALATGNALDLPDSLDKPHVVTFNPDESWPTPTPFEWTEAEEAAFAEFWGGQTMLGEVMCGCGGVVACAGVTIWLGVLPGLAVLCGGVFWLVRSTGRVYDARRAAWAAQRQAQAAERSEMGIGARP